MSAPHWPSFELGPSSRTAVYAAAPSMLSAPTGLSAVSQGPTSVLVRWQNRDSRATGYNVYRSTDGWRFGLVKTVKGGAANSYVDGTVSPNRTYWYLVQAVAGTRGSGVGPWAKVTTDLAAPTGLAAAASGAGVDLSWSDSNGAGVGFIVLRSENGKTFTTLGQVKAGGGRAYSDRSVVSGHTYWYRVKATSGTRASAAGNTASVAAPDGSGAGTGTTTDTVTISTRYGNELVVTSNGADNISVSEAGSVLTIVAGGRTYTQAAPSAGVFIYDRAGDDTITIDASVTTRTTITSLGGGIDRILSSGTNVSAWLDPTDFYTGAGSVHWVGALAGNVSKATGASLPNPTDAGTTFKLNASLWGNGPAAGDVNQGGVGDCYFLASLAAFAGVKPAVLTESAVDLGDGTYVVRFMQQGTPVDVRVSNDISSGNYWGYQFARPGASGAVWALVMEKAYAFFRYGTNTYASISGGWMGDVYSDLGVGSISFGLQTSESAFYSMVSNDLLSGRAVTFGTNSFAPVLVGGHAYTLVSASMDSGGVTHYVVRNPWGVAGDARENSAGYASLTFAEMQTNFMAGVQAAA
jgi:hypothetical protein